MKPQLKVGLFGAHGRMGQRVTHCVGDAADLTMHCALDHTDVGDFLGCDVVVDFSVAPATSALCERLAAAHIPLVTGVTGRDGEQRRAIDALGLTRPVFVASNFSLGVAVLNELVRQGTRALGEDFVAEVMEVHHRFKADAPSGTALSLARTISEAKGLPWPESQVNRRGPSEPRNPTEIGMASLRGGDVVGDHTVYLLGPSERIELTHRAENRDVFALGALRAVRWVLGRDPGLYGMADLVAAAGDPSLGQHEAP